MMTCVYETHDTVVIVLIMIKFSGVLRTSEILPNEEIFHFRSHLCKID